MRAAMIRRGAGTGARSGWRTRRGNARIGTGETMSAVPGRASLPRRGASALRTLIATVYCAVTAAIVSDARPGSHPGA